MLCGAQQLLSHLYLLVLQTYRHQHLVGQLLRSNQLRLQAHQPFFGLPQVRHHRELKYLRIGEVQVLVVEDSTRQTLH